METLSVTVKKSFGLDNQQPIPFLQAIANGAGSETILKWSRVQEDSKHKAKLVICNFDDIVRTLVKIREGIRNRDIRNILKI